RSYRDLPVRYFETTTAYRDEKTGELGGLYRVRSLTQDDSHVYARADQIEAVVGQLVADVKTFYETLGLKVRARLSYRDDSDQYLGEAELWQSAQATIKQLADKNQLDYFEAEGEAAFYGPKIDFMATDALSREHQVATVQLDFVQPERFGLEYTAEDGSKARPVMIHCAILGSVERFLSVYIEHTAGKFPIWLAPEQVRLIQVNDSEPVQRFVDDFMTRANQHGIRIQVDNSNESVGKKIRLSQVMKVPYSLVIGDKEIETGKLAPRIRGDLAVEGRPESAYGVDQFLNSLANEIRGRVSKSSL
ncbi:MAG TPA: threonine--tRNA ligase, partial [Candidatus Saccharimonadales bacterium]|nr:threonine--tRNA ligase [Candidatus Saccharimonadales bacterium]